LGVDAETAGLIPGIGSSRAGVDEWDMKEVRSAGFDLSTREGKSPPEREGVPSSMSIDPRNQRAKQDRRNAPVTLLRPPIGAEIIE
jgi:hypothetical protein